MKSRKIAGVSVNTENPPKKEDLIKSALKTVEYYRTPNATELIEKKIDKSGLYNKVSTATKAKAKQSRNTKGGRRTDTDE